MKKEVLTIVISAFTARVKKRICALSKKYDINLYYITRISDNEILRESTFAFVKSANHVATIENGKYINRIFTYFKFLLILKKRATKKIYFFGADFQFFFFFLKNKIYLEIGDLRIVDMKGLKKKLFTAYDKYSLKHVSKLILTSEHHFSDYYNLYVDNDKVLILRNRLEKNQTLISYDRKLSEIKEKIKIGLFGMLRYDVPMDFLIEFIIKHKEKYELVIYGIPFGKYSINYLEKLDRHNNNISWNGKYLYPDDLGEIYSKIDLSFVVYDNAFENVKTAIPNKLYESVLFNKPILCGQHTKFAEEVKKYDIGIEIPINNFDSFEKKLLDIGKKEITYYSNKMNKLGFDFIFENDEYVTTI